MGQVVADEFWTLQEASDEIGLTVEGIRLWTKGDPPRVRSQRVWQGRRERVLVNREDALRESALAASRRTPSAHPKTAPAAVADNELRDRVAVLEEVVRRQRIIKEQQDEIAERYREISRQQDEIAELLMAPSWVPDP